MDSEAGASNAQPSMALPESGSSRLSTFSLTNQLSDVTAERDEALAKLERIQEEFMDIQAGNYDGMIGQLFLQFKEANSENDSQISGKIGMDDTDYLHEEIDELRVQLQASEEALADARIALAREREYAEIMNQDDDHAAAQAAEMKHQATRLAAVEHDLSSARSLNSELQSQLEEASTLISELEGQVETYRHEMRDAKQEIAAQSEEINFAANRANDLEEKLLQCESKSEEAHGQLEALREQLSAEHEGHSTEVTEMREEMSRVRNQLHERERRLRKLQDEVESVPRLESVPSQQDLGASLKSEIGSSQARVDEDTLEALRLLRTSNEFPSIEPEMDVLRAVQEVLSETRSRHMLHAQTERNLKNVQQRLDTSATALQMRTALLMKTTRWLEQAAVHLSKYTRMKPSESSKANEAEGDEDTEGRNAKLQESADAAHELMNVTLETLDTKIKELFNAQRMQLSKAAQQHQQALKLKVQEFQAEVAKYRQLVGFPCKYVGCTEAPSPRPSQAQLWACIDRIEKDAVAGTPPSPVVVASVPRSSYKGHPWPSSMYVRGQDGKVLVSKPYLHFCSVGQVETYVIFVAYTRMGSSKGRKFYVHAFGCQSTGDAETLSEMVIRQCEQAHKLNKEMQAAKKEKEKRKAGESSSSASTASTDDDIPAFTSKSKDEKEKSKSKDDKKSKETVKSPTKKLSLGLSALSPTRRSVKDKKPKRGSMSRSSSKGSPITRRGSVSKSPPSSKKSSSSARRVSSSAGTTTIKEEEAPARRASAPIKEESGARRQSSSIKEEGSGAPAGFGDWSKSVV